MRACRSKSSRSATIARIKTDDWSKNNLVRRIRADLSAMMLISFLVVIGMFLNRYIRSWKIFDAIFHNSKFHFFLYLCTSEILPMAVLLKILITTLI
ncbi:MAG: DUF4271 domain-containing protein [Chitinophagia bacterium]|nr:DUF4271 domain-containing protein [Chitinophagia bacterium]